MARRRASCEPSEFQIQRKNQEIVFTCGPNFRGLRVSG